jgi:CubicO group peptidase (beta-lactamase class C family)
MIDLSRSLQSAAGAMCLLLLPVAAPAQDNGTPAAPNASPVSPTIQQVRRAILQRDLNAFYFQHMDDLFFTRPVPAGDLVWPLTRRDAAPDITYGWEGALLGFDEFLDRTYTNALVVLKDGEIVTETYRNNSTDQTRFASWSMAKSFVSTMVGLAVADGHIASLDEPVTRYLPELAEGAYGGVTIRQVLEMNSGVDYEERYDFENPGIAAWNHENALVQNRVRFVDAARTISRAHQPGEVFAYKTIDTAVLGWLVERVTDRPIAQYMSEKLWEPLGAEQDGFFIMDGPTGIGREFTGAGFAATARDFARFGQMVLDGGVANGRQVVPAEWLAQATGPAMGEGPEGGYGYQWWTVPNSDAFYALGLEGQFIYIDPATRTVVVKLSYIPLEEQAVYGEVLTAMQALADWTPQ